ncbi:Predicted NTP binding protein (contains STAS domain) [Phocoenobacter uteri]|uniref:Predicted NTP binding protein (Contains STAS domain) n=1 Tax=Phocoenobacter uteri TaxID=146806 RepID=A0A379CB59_9PAST|nr:STAS domain-containing protein [Phocoenobacter uteri]MDG6881344.1 hypothetical protein [Phocoenobacter uteri]SUB59368.1 Predicted NTP binding protein (contains STAS domain) [Phocoenobacter uteri]
MKSTQSINWYIKQEVDYIQVDLSGSLTRDTLFPLWEQRHSFLSTELCNTIHWNLSDIDVIDSAGLALLVELLHLYHTKNNRLINLPQSVSDLAILFGLEDWLISFKL